jgi:hypothetical protein
MTQARDVGILGQFPQNSQETRESDSPVLIVTQLVQTVKGQAYE